MLYIKQLHKGKLCTPHYPIGPTFNNLEDANVAMGQYPEIDFVLLNKEGKIVVISQGCWSKDEQT